MSLTAKYALTIFSAALALIYPTVILHIPNAWGDLQKAAPSKTTCSRAMQRFIEHILEGVPNNSRLDGIEVILAGKHIYTDGQDIYLPLPYIALTTRWEELYFLIAHEMCHIKLGHNKVDIKTEFAADDCALRMLPSFYRPTGFIFTALSSLIADSLALEEMLKLRIEHMERNTVKPQRLTNYSKSYQKIISECTSGYQ